MVRQIGVHDDDEVARGIAQTVHVGRAQTQLCLPGSQLLRARRLVG